MYKKNKNGFTLIELLVVIVIIGIITVLALPGVQQLQERNRMRKFEIYGDGLESAGKLFTDSYSDDMFGMQGNGCYDIPYSELRGKSLIKDFEVDGITCNSDKTFVQVKRENNKYTYDVSLYCTQNGKVVYQSEPVTPCNNESGSGSLLPKIDISYTNDSESIDGVWSKSKKVTIKVSALEGLIDNISILYGWSTDKNVKPTSMSSYNFRNDYGASSVTMSFDDSGKTGEYYLFVEGDDIIDAGGHVAIDALSSVMKFDNTAPSCLLKATESQILFNSITENTSGVAKSGISKSNTPNYNSSNLNISADTFYGHVVDNAGNTNLCTLTIKNTTPRSYSCNPYSCNPYKCNCHWWCPDGRDDPLCLGGDQICSTCYRTCYETCTAYDCPSGYTKINNTYCYKMS